jgi:hypothetical protein
MVLIIFVIEVILPFKWRQHDVQDEEAELLAELERIKKERAEEAARKAKEEAEIAQREMHQEVARGNPLLNPGGFQVKRRWDDDVVFRNQVRLTACTSVLVLTYPLCCGHRWSWWQVCPPKRRVKTTKHMSYHTGSTSV